MASAILGISLLTGGVHSPFARWTILLGGGTHVVSPDGEDIYAAQGRIGVTQSGLAYAPEPRHAFRGASCDSSSGRAAHVRPLSWAMPRLGVGGSLELSGAHGEPVRLPDAPGGALFADGAGITAVKGATLLAGHVDFADGRLSPWGHLHEVRPCERILVRGDQGETREFAVTDLYTVPQDDLIREPLFRRDGGRALYMVTCSGPSVADAGGAFRFRYSHNLIVRAQPVTTQRPAATAAAKAEWLRVAGDD